MSQDTTSRPADRIETGPTAGHNPGHSDMQVPRNTARTRRTPDTTSSALLLTVAQAAALLAVSHWTVRGWIDCGKLPSVRLPGGRLVRVERSAVDALVAKSRMSA